jgi:hypothetical protein
MPRFKCLVLGLVVALAPLQAHSEPRAVLELFTSQGCSSCVEADRLMAELASRDDVIALALHVDYWDYLGWKDTFGQPEHSARQREYAEVHGSRRIYTPQMIVNGAVEVVGHDRAALDAAIEQTKLPVPVTLHRKDGTLVIKVGSQPLPGRRPTTIRLILFSSAVDVAITRGENAGSTVRYHNVVRAIRPIGMWDGTMVKVTLPEEEMMADGVDGCAVIVQEDLPDGPGMILGAAQLRDVAR